MNAAIHSASGEPWEIRCAVAAVKSPRVRVWGVVMSSGKSTILRREVPRTEGGG